MTQFSRIGAQGKLKRIEVRTMLIVISQPVLLIKRALKMANVIAIACASQQNEIIHYKVFSATLQHLITKSFFYIYVEPILGMHLHDCG